MNGQMTEAVRLDGTLSAIDMLHGTLAAAMTLTGEMSEGSGGQYYRHYEGAYTITPEWEGQTLETNGLVMDDDVEVNPIQLSETSNPAGGITVYIGGDINYG